MKKIEEEKKEKGKGKRISGIRDFNWEISAWKNPDGSTLYYISKLFNGKFKGRIICNKKELKDLKRFMKERKFK